MMAGAGGACFLLVELLVRNFAATMEVGGRDGCCLATGSTVDRRAVARSGGGGAAPSAVLDRPSSIHFTKKKAPAAGVVRRAAALRDKVHDSGSRKFGRESTAPKRPSAPSLLRSSPPSTTCSRTVPAIRTWALTTSIVVPKPRRPSGKRRSTRMRKGAPWLKTTLIQCSWAPRRERMRWNWAWI